MRKHGQGTFGRKALKGPALAGQTSLRTRQERHLGIFALDRRIGMAIRVNHERCPEMLTILNDAHALCVLRGDLSGTPGVHLDSRGLYGLHQTLVQTWIVHHRTQLRNVPVGMTNDGSAQATFLGNMDVLNDRSLVRPSLKRFEQYPATVIEGQYSRILIRCIAIVRRRVGLK